MAGRFSFQVKLNSTSIGFIKLKIMSSISDMIYLESIRASGSGCKTSEHELLFLLIGFPDICSLKAACFRTAAEFFLLTISIIIS